MENITSKALFSLFCLIFASTLCIGVAYADSTFSTTLKLGSTGPEVVKLQNFLVGQGLLSATLPTGKYLGMTQKAVAAFQTTQGIAPIGIFGPLTQAAANKVALAHTVVSIVPVASVSSMSVSNSNSGVAAVVLSNQKTIKWSTSNYPADAGVNINLVRKVSSNPTSYTLVRAIATNTPNDGQQTWNQSGSEIGDDLYIEVTCSSTYQFTGGCASMTPVKVN